MFDLFTAEVRRYRKGVLIFALLHFVIAVSVVRTTPILQGPKGFPMIGLLFYLLAGIALAALQFGSYRQPARWLWLLHRPLERWKIFLALHGAAALLGILALALPLGLALFALDKVGTNIVDTRHYLMSVHALIFALLAWQVTAAALLARRRGVALLLLLPLMLASLYTASAVVLLLPALAMLAIGGMAMYATFQPDRQITAARPWQVLALALPLAMVLYVTFTWSSAFLYRAGGAVFGWDPSRPANIKPGSFLDVLTQSANRENFLLKSELAKVKDSRIKEWSEELAVNPPHLMIASRREHMVRHQIANTGGPVWRDRAGVLWNFSHDQMHFIGHSERGGAALSFGLQGKDDAKPFDSMTSSTPVFPAHSEMPSSEWAGHRAFISPTELRITEPGQSRPQLVQSLQGEEKFAISEVVNIKGRFYILTNLRLLAFELEPGKPARTVLSLPLPGPLSDLTRVTLACIAKGCFHTFIYGRDMEFGAQGSKLSIFYVPNDGAPELLVQRPLANILGTWYVDKDWWISPLIFGLLELPQVAIDTGLIADAGQVAGATHLLMSRPREAIVMAAVLALLSLAAGLWWTAGLPRRYRLAWALGCLLFSLPALASLMILHARPALAAKRSAVAQAA